MTLVRVSPSGPEVQTGSGAVESVFGRTGIVIAVTGDYFTGIIANQSAATGDTVSDALDIMQASDSIANESNASGITLSDALNTLFAGTTGGSGLLNESFLGGNGTTVVASSTVAGVGDLGWNYITFGTATGNSCAKATQAQAPGTVGCVRVTSPTANGAGACVYLGSPTVGLFLVDDWQTVTFLARPDSVQGANEISQFGVMNVPNQVLGAGESAGFFTKQSGTGASPNYQTITSHLGTGNTPQDTGVPIDNLFHTFVIERPDATVIAFYIDGVLRTAHRTAFGDGMPEGAVVPFAGAVGGGSSTLIDVDNFVFDPL